MYRGFTITGYEIRADKSCSSSDDEGKNVGGARTLFSLQMRDVCHLSKKVAYSDSLEQFRRKFLAKEARCLHKNWANRSEVGISTGLGQSSVSLTVSSARLISLSVDEVETGQLLIRYRE